MIIDTKLHIPQRKQELVVRQRLYNQLEQGLCRKLTLIAAPAGTEKQHCLASGLSS